MSGYGQKPYGSGPYGGGTRSRGRFSQATEDAYARLPDFYREADVDGVLKRWMSALFDQVGEMRVLRERFALEPSRPNASAPTGEQLARTAAGMPVTGAWTAVPTIRGVGLKATGPDPSSAVWEVTVVGGTYRLTMSWEAGPDRGIARVVVDGVTEFTIDTYAAATSSAVGAQVAASLPLARGLHTVRVHWTGAKRAAATNDDIVITGLGLTNLTGLALDSSDLVDPSTAEPAWLPWLAQLVGGRLRAELDVAGRRDAVRQAARLQSGSYQAMVEAVRTVLTGSRAVQIRPHTRVDTTTPISSGPWDLTIITNATETPGGAASVLDAVRRLEAKPAGVRLFHALYTATWADFQTRFPTNNWTALNAATTYAKLQEAA